MRRILSSKNPCIVRYIPHASAANILTIPRTYLVGITYLRLKWLQCLSVLTSMFQP